MTKSIPPPPSRSQIGSTPIWGLVRDALRLERDEVGDLARSFFRPSGAGRILDILLASLLPGTDKRDLQGGLAYPVGPFFSSRYADVVAEQYRAMRFFATVVRAPADAVSAPPAPATS